MNNDFSRSLAFLRREKGVSQRVAASELLVSQALLSHYENGIREPGLNFVVRACDYYQVSADFLLGRTLSRDGTAVIALDKLRDIARGKRPADPGSLGLLAKRLLGDSVEFLLDILARTGNEAIIRAGVHSLGTGIYTLFRHFCLVSGANNQDIFSVSAQKFSLSAATIDALSCEMEYVEALLTHAGQEGEFPDLSEEALDEQNALHQSLLQITYITGERINRRLGS